MRRMLYNLVRVVIIALILAGSVFIFWNMTHAPVGAQGSANVTVRIRSGIDHLEVRGINDPITAGERSDVIVSAINIDGNVATDYRGTIRFTSSDTDARIILPANYTFTEDDLGTHSFSSGVRLITKGEQSVTAGDTSTSSLLGTQTNITVIASGVTSLDTRADDTTLTANGTDQATITASLSDQYGNASNDGTKVTFSILSGPGSLENFQTAASPSAIGEFSMVASSLSRSTLDGEAKVTFKSGTVVGETVIQIASEGLTRQLTIASIAGAPRGVITASGDNVAQGEPVEIVSSKVTDEFGNIVVGVTVTFIITKPDGTFIEIEGVTGPDGIARITLPGTETKQIGDYTVVVRAENLVTGPATTFRVSEEGEVVTLDPPVVISPRDNQILDTGTPTIQGTSIPNGTITVYIYALDGTILTLSTTADGAGAWSVTIPDSQALANGRYGLQAKVADAAGNNSPLSALIQFIVDVPPPKTLIEEIIEIIDDPERSIIEKGIDIVDEVVRFVQKNENIIRIVDNIVEPVITIGAVVTAAAVLTTTTTAIELTNIIYLLGRFGYFWIVPVMYGKRRKPWGVVFDNTTNKPIRNAVVRIFSKEFDKLKESQITDPAGRFGFLVDVGEYYVTASKPGYLFPSTIITSAALTYYYNIYRGEIITVEEKREGMLHINIPMDPEHTHLSPRRLLWLRILNTVALFLEKINVPLLFGGTMISAVVVIIKATPFNGVILLIYGILLLAKAFLILRIQKSLGHVVDSETNKPVELALVRIFNMDRGSILATKVTNRAGRFFAIADPGAYYLIVTKPGYATYRSEPLTITKQRGIFKILVKLQKQTPEPSANQPSAPQPLAIQPLASQPSANQPTAQQPPASQPSADQPTASQPHSSPPVTDLSANNREKKEKGWK